MTATLTYINHVYDSTITCAICLEPVDKDAVKVSCHASLMCADCLGHWLTSLILAGKQAKCICSSRVDVRNMKPLVYEQVEGGSDWMEYEFEEYEYDEYEDDWGFSDEDFDDFEENEEEGEEEEEEEGEEEDENENEDEE